MQISTSLLNIFLLNVGKKKRVELQKESVQGWIEGSNSSCTPPAFKILCLPFLWNSCRGAVEKNLTRNHAVSGSIPGLAKWVKDPALL